MTSKLVDNLRNFGLSDYEAKAYSAVVSAGTGSVTEISQLCDVPRSNLYAVLESLSEKGFVDIQKGRPLIFKAISPENVFDELVRTKSNELRKAKTQILDEVEKISDKTKADIVPALIWGVRGYTSVLNKIGEITSRSRKELLVNIPDLSIINERMFGELEKAKTRGVKIKIVTEKKGDLKKHKKVASVRVRDKIHGVDIVSDDKEILIAPSFPIVAAWVDNPEMAMHVKDFLTLVWKDAKVLK